MSGYGKGCNEKKPDASNFFHLEDVDENKDSSILHPLISVDPETGKRVYDTSRVRFSKLSKEDQRKLMEQSSPKLNLPKVDENEQKKLLSSFYSKCKAVENPCGENRYYGDIAWSFLSGQFDHKSKMPQSTSGMAMSALLKMAEDIDKGRRYDRLVEYLGHTFHSPKSVELPQVPDRMKCFMYMRHYLTRVGKDHDTLGRRALLLEAMPESLDKILSSTPDTCSICAEERKKKEEKRANVMYRDISVQTSPSLTSSLYARPTTNPRRVSRTNYMLHFMPEPAVRSTRAAPERGAKPNSNNAIPTKPNVSPAFAPTTAAVNNKSDGSGTWKKPSDAGKQETEKPGGCEIIRSMLDGTYNYTPCQQRETSGINHNDDKIGYVLENFKDNAKGPTYIHYRDNNAASTKPDLDASFEGIRNNSVPLTPTSTPNSAPTKQKRPSSRDNSGASAAKKKSAFSYPILLSGPPKRGRGRPRKYPRQD